VLDQDFVTVLAEDLTVEQRPVRLGRRLDGAWTVDEGLEPGETIVLDGAQKLRPGMRVRPQPAADQG
jgi:multidrug efflux pump subunit AcrA (membrane-fusion protein)